MESYILIILVAIQLIFSFLLFFMVRDSRRRVDELESTFLDQYEKWKKWIDRLMEKEQKERRSDFEKGEEGNQKRYTYIKRELNQILDALDHLRERERKTLDKLMPNPSSELKKESPPLPEAREMKQEERISEGMGEAKVPEILSLYHRGISPLEIAKQLQLPIPQVEMVLRIFAKEEQDQGKKGGV